MTYSPQPCPDVRDVYNMHVHGAPTCIAGMRYGPWAATTPPTRRHRRLHASRIKAIARSYKSQTLYLSEGPDRGSFGSESFGSGASGSGSASSNASVKVAPMICVLLCCSCLYMVRLTGRRAERWPFHQHSAQ